MTRVCFIPTSCLSPSRCPACSCLFPASPLLSHFLRGYLTRLPGAAGRDGDSASDLRSAAVPLLEAGHPMAISSLSFFQVWGQILTAIACPLPSLLPPSPPSLLPVAGTRQPLAPRSLPASSIPPSLI